MSDTGAFASSGRVSVDSSPVLHSHPRSANYYGAGNFQETMTGSQDVRMVNEVVKAFTLQGHDAEAIASQLADLATSPLLICSLSRLRTRNEMARAVG